jgi:hypothetical protein
VINGTEAIFGVPPGQGGFADLDRAGDRPLPCKYVVQAGRRRATVQRRVQELEDRQEVATADFAFKNSTNAEKIDLKDLADKVSEFPANFTMGGKQ